ncbi:MAG: outer membrane protein assembly factor BamD [Pigmentiphaga sp.]|nr:outer membrane protein assembly factor BamD [Pigmentiphaga sp.]
MAVASSLLSGCGWLNANSGEAHDDTVGWSAEQLYRDAKSELDSGNWEAALTQLERVQARYPFGVYAQQAMLDTAYAQWRSGSREQALATIQRFQQQYPNHEATDYMLYLKGLVTFAPENAFINRLVGQDMAERDPAGARASFEAFTELVQRYPDSRYARDARLRLNWLLNTIAMGELYTARYYYNRQAYVAAINRAETVIADFQGTEAAEQALYLMVLSYEQLDMPELRDDARRVLVTNFPQTRLLSEGFPDTSNSKWWNPFSWSSNL